MVDRQRTRTPTKSNRGGVVNSSSAASVSSVDSFGSSSLHSNQLFRVDSECEDFEVTHEDFQRVSPHQKITSHRGGRTGGGSGGTAGGGGGGGVAQRLSNMLLRPRNQNHHHHHHHHHHNAPSQQHQQQQRSSTTTRNRRAVANHAGDLSFSSDHATITSENGGASESNASVMNSNFTVASNDTVKASNKSEHPSSMNHNEDEDDDGVLRFRKRWTKFKVLVGGKIPEEPENVPRQHSFSADYSKASPAVRQRLNSLPPDASPKRVRSNPNNILSNSSLNQQSMTDQSIRGRLDGVDCIALGPLDPFTILPWLAEQAPLTFTGKRLDSRASQTPAEMIATMLWSSCGRELPEIILEGFMPGCDDRWTVRVEERREQSRASLFSLIRGTFRGVSGCDGQDQLHNTTSMPSPGADEKTEELVQKSPSEDAGSPILPTHRLWHKLWGSETKPVSAAAICPVEEDDPLLSLAAEYSIPIDLDENTFCVSERTHLETIHTFVAVSLSMGRFMSAIMILKKLLRGIDLIKEEEMRFLKGSTYHNIGMIYLWNADYNNAVEYFHIAVQERTNVLPKDHPDIAVSLVRKGQAQFALGRFEDALFAMELALPMTPHEHIVRAKVLNNMGAIHYFNANPILAMKEFTASLEISRLWLECSIRRDAIIYDASATLSNMGRIYMERKDFDLAYYVYEEALLLQTTTYRKGHDLVLSSLTSLALCRARQDKVKKALQLLQGCLRSKNARFGKDSPESIETLGMMGLMYEHLEMHEDALKCISAVRKWQRTNLPSNHASLRKTKQITDKLEDSLGKKFSIWV